MTNNRAGFFQKQLEGYSAFVPKRLPPAPPVQLEAMRLILSQADLNIGRLDGITQTLPNPEMFVAMYVKKEALLSSQIEGTQASLIDILDAEDEDEDLKPVREVVAYVDAINYGLERLETLPLSLRLLREIHERLLRNGRGSNRNPGEFRTSQNWIGPAGSNLTNAAFIPPTVSDMKIALAELESYFYDERDTLPPLVKIALIHSQFETIHPFLDGNGRMGRLLITFWLCQQHILSQPLLYLSYYFKRNRAEYYDRLMAVRINGQWEEWVKFFLCGVSEVAEEACETAKKILRLRESVKETLTKERNTSLLRLFDHMFERPIMTVREAERFLGVSNTTAGSAVERLVQIGILRDATPGMQRKKKFVFHEYVKLLEAGTE
ncbi:cell division protein Fic [Clostridia bacterium]|nr:cell division protein Fic [Clostridia bacterium]